jgi:hypothetical protein
VRELGQDNRDIQCQACGHVQTFDPDYSFCRNCGQPIKTDSGPIIKNPRVGRGMQGSAVLAFVASMALFWFWSKYLGSAGMGISFLVWVWGLYKAHLNRKQGGEHGN